MILALSQTGRGRFARTRHPHPVSACLRSSSDPPSLLLWTRWIAAVAACDACRGLPLRRVINGRTTS